MTTLAHYRPPAKLLHWLTAIAIFCVVPLGIAMVEAAPGPGQNQLYDLHRSFGALVLTLTALRLLWRLYSPPPPPPVTNMPPWQAWASQVMHGALYVLLFAVPLMGWAGTSAFGARIMIFGLFELPMVLDKDRDLATVLLSIHVYLAFTLCALFVIHIGAAIHHQVVRKNAVLRRMLPRFGAG
ncbi:MAG: cytochrome b [Rhodospirillaceae bacterium]|nr:cytochrome b [Rhodospirillaceae bacterium]